MALKTKKQKKSKKKKKERKGFAPAHSHPENSRRNAKLALENDAVASSSCFFLMDDCTQMQGKGPVKGWEADTLGSMRACDDSAEV